MSEELKPDYSSPQKCQNGCARWDNLSADGNTQDQTYANKLWQGGNPPPDAKNMCAQPANDQKQGPWCYCAGTNDNSWGYCQSRDLNSSICKSTPNGLTTVFDKLNNCRSSTENKRNDTFAQLFRTEKDIEMLNGIVQDSLMMGDSVFGKAGSGQILSEIKQRNKELKQKKEDLSTDLEKKEAIIERSNRDFEYTRQELPDSLPVKTLNVVEDYTLAVLIVAYLFMLIAVLYVYVTLSENKMRAIVFGGLSGIIVSMFLYILLYMLG